MSADPNIDLAVMERRMDDARLSSCASAVSHRGRREITARERQCRRAEAVPASNDDEKQALDPLTALVQRRARQKKDKADEPR